jgi:hypothetical protein
MDNRVRNLRVALVAVGAIFIGAGALLVVWPSGWRWQPHHLYYEEMILGIYATLGVFLLRAARQPLAHLSLIWFTVWSSVVHGAIMGVQAMAGAHDHGHLIGDVPALLIVAVALAVLAPRPTSSRSPAAR